ncbi:putative ABC transporter, P-loop containing nucleoside triphosphate hydrolase [Helianthus anomalus]
MRPGQVLGLVGTNGIGKSTTLKVLVGKLKPNLGCFIVIDRNVGDLSRGELQRFEIAVVAIKNAAIYMFDEPSSYLDVKQRLKGKGIYIISHPLN